VRRVHACTAALAAVMLLAVPHSLAADPVVITSGVITAQPPILLGDAVVRLEGDTFALQGRFPDGGTGLCFPCVAGTYTFGMSWGGDMGSGSGIVNGTMYPSLWFAGTGFTVGGSATIPPDGPSRLSLTFPFSVVAGSTIWGFSDSQRTNQVFTLDVTGSGTAEMSIGRPESGPQLYTTQALSFTFGPSPAPTPEPTSLLLIGTGLVGVILRRARRAPRA
jgi:PEP-CTERM motif